MALTPGSANAPWRAPCCAWGVPPGALESRTWRMHTVPGRGWWDDVGWGSGEHWLPSGNLLHSY